MYLVLTYMLSFSEIVLFTLAAYEVTANEVTAYEVTGLNVHVFYVTMPICIVLKN